MRTLQLRQQHQNLLDVAGRISGLLARAEIPLERAEELRRLLLDLGGKLSMHLAAEDKVLYPELVASPEARTASTARRFAEEMGGIGAAWKQFMTRYPTPASIAADAASFRKELGAVLDVLGKRIQREEAELYPLADAAALH